jgi:hypothetical protein
MNRKLDTDSYVFFYEQDFYVLSNFSAFCLYWRGKPFFTSEHAYHWPRSDLLWMLVRQELRSQSDAEVKRS